MFHFYESLIKFFSIFFPDNKVSSILGEMPQLEDIEDDYNDSVNAFNSDDNLSSKSCNSKRMFTLMPNLEDIEPEKIDSSSNSKNSKSFCSSFYDLQCWV